MKINTKPFGEYQGEPINQYMLTNDQNMVVKIINYGATITSISVPDSSGKSVELACGFDTLESYFSEAYRQNAPYFGCTVGRYASRIKDGQFKIDGKKYSLAINDNSNHLHGGIVGLDKQVWSAETVEQEDAVGVKMSLTSPDGDEGYPGQVDVTVTFLLNNKNQLSIRYFAETNQTTPLSLTNHTYFNLSGFQDTIENHRATIYSEAYLAPDETNVPVGEVAAVERTPADLRSGKILKEAFQELETGFEHYYQFENTGALQKVAEFAEPASGSTLEVATNEPGMLFYTGYFTSDHLQRENGNQYGRYLGFCCETSRYPNGPNLEDSPGSLTSPGKPYRSETIFTINTNN